MKSVSLSSPEHLSVTSKPGMFSNLARRLVLGKFRNLETGHLVLIDGDNQMSFGESAETATLRATITVKDQRFYSDIAFGGSIGAGESYMTGGWDCDDLVTVIRLLVQNRSVLDQMDSGSAIFTRPLQKTFHWINRNTRKGARRNISVHYDLGNDFFSLWLDQSMMYSSAIFDQPDMSLAEAQVARLDRICENLDLGHGDHVIEIGTGWGGFALHAASKYGCRVTTTTISREQYEMTWKRVEEAGLQDRIELLFEDYRDLNGTYDKLVSIEMIEAIGWKQFDTYFAKCSKLLKPGGKMLIQAITIADQNFEKAKRSVDFIQRYIFPGSNLTSVASMSHSIATATDLQVTGLTDIGLDYAKTLRAWRENFFARLNEVKALGYSEEFIRMWEYYFCYCEGGFTERVISDVHLQARKPL